MATKTNTKIAKKYAEALLASYQESGKSADSVTGELKAIKQVFSQNPELKSLLQHPAIDAEVKENILKESFGSKLSPKVANLVLILFKRKRLDTINSLDEEFKALYCESQGISVAKLSSVQQVKDSQVQEIKQELERLSTNKVEIITEIDESLIAGYKVQLDDKILDSSLKARLKQLRELIN